MRSTRNLLLLCAALAPVSALAQRPPGDQAGFEPMWTGWSRVNREAMAVESEAMRRMRADLAAADAGRLSQLRGQGRELGEQVGEIVRGGDCAQGERVARQAGDFALVEAVRRYCGAPASRDDH
jgi:hypothetical protein